MNSSSCFTPPAFFLRFFRWFCDPALAEDIEGDLTEMFQRDAEQGTLRSARVRFSMNVIRLFRPGIVNPFRRKSSYTNPSPMLKNYFITSLRSLMRSGGYSAINIAGLAVGFAMFSLIALYVYHELSVDRYHVKADRIFRVVEDLRTDRELLYQAASSPPMGPHLLKDMPEVESYVRFQNWNLLAFHKGISAYEPNSYIADSTVFDIFTIPLLKGDKKTALRDPYSIVLTESMVKHYFGDEDPMGQMIQMDNDNFKITGVMADVPENSHFVFTNLISFSTWSSRNKEIEMSQWFWNGFTTYILLKEHASIDGVRAKMHDFISRYIEKGGSTYQDLPLQPLTSIYLAGGPTRSGENGTRGSMSNVYVLSIIAAFILLIACFNYINLATARASRRLKEVGLRKSLGAQRSMLIAQFLGESILITLVAAIIASVIAWLVLPSFRTLVDSPLSLSILPNPFSLAIRALGFVLLIGIFAGAYPAFIISRFQPLQIFRPSTKGIYSHHGVRRALVTIQFIISIALVAGTLLVNDQISLVRKHDLGFTRDATLILPTNGDSAIVDHLEAVKNELKTVRGVRAVTGSSNVPGLGSNNLFTQMEISEGKMSPTSINYFFVDYDFISTYDIKIVEGRNFLREVGADDTTAMLINETAVKGFGWTPKQAIGRKVNHGQQKRTIIGVVKDFNYASLHHEVEPLLLQPTHWVARLSIKIDPADIPATVLRAESKWKEMLPHLPFAYTFLDVDFDRQYKADQQLGKVAGVFTGLAIVIGCLGLLGLTSFAVERRVKEIGIRKVLGASTGHLVELIAREQIILISIALIIATPLTWYLIRQWELNFTLRAAINPIWFVVAGVSVFAVAGATISYLSFRAASANPTVALRTE